MSQSVEKSTPLFSDTSLRDVKTYGDALSLLQEVNVTLISTKDLGIGFDILKNKDQLIDVPFVILDSVLNKGENGFFVSLYVVTEKGDKLIMNDGSTGIRKQVVEFYQLLNNVTLDPASAVGTHLLQGVQVPSGLTRSDYTYTDEKTGEAKSATTYYLS